MGKKKQEMAQVYSGSKDEFIFGEEGGRGKNLSSFLKNLSLTGSATSPSRTSTSRDSIEEANKNIYGSLSYKGGNDNRITSSLWSSPSHYQYHHQQHQQQEQQNTSPRPLNIRSLSSGVLNHPHLHFQSTLSIDKKLKGSNNGRINYKDLDDDWNSEISEDVSIGATRPTNASYPSLSIGSKKPFPEGEKQHDKYAMGGGEALQKATEGGLGPAAFDAKQSKFRKFRSVLANDGVIDINELRKLSWNGIPDELRALAWLLLLGYLPTNRTRQASTLKRKRQEYFDGVVSMNINFEDSTGIGGAKHQLQQHQQNQKVVNSRENNIYHQIKIDVKRTNPTLALYAHSSTQVSLQKILYLWAIRHPASGYVQGINDLATPFYQTFLAHYIWQLKRKKGKKMKEDEILFIPGYISCGGDDDDEVESEKEEKEEEEEETLLLNSDDILQLDVQTFDPGRLSARVISLIEADTYWCLSRLLETITDNYIHEQPGILRQVSELKTLISKIDSDLIRHFDSEGIEFVQFAFRWINCLLMRELPMQLIVRMWDTYLSEQPLGFNTFHTYVCAAFLIRFSKELKLKDFQEILLFLQNPPTSSWKEKDVELMLSEAYIWQTLYKNAAAHLK